MKVLKYSFAAVAGAILAGCGAPPPPADETTPAPAELPVNVSSNIGIGATQLQDPKLVRAVALKTGAKVGSARPDPFELKPYEKQYDTEQSTARIVSGSGFDSYFTPATETEHAPPVVEPQPYRRLAGVVVGDSVLAIIDMGGGSAQLIRPGQKIPDTEWTVVSIDEDKAVLRRSGPTLPHEITVRLESPPSDMGGGAPGGGNPSFGGGTGGAGGDPGLAPGGGKASFGRGPGGRGPGGK